MGIMDFGLMFQQYEVITNAAREGARVAMLPNYNITACATCGTQRATDYVNAALITGGTNGAPTAAMPPRTSP